MNSQQPVRSSAAESSAAAAVVWLTVQLGVLMLMSGRVPLWARMEAPIEQWTLHLMLAAQVATSAALFPWLMRNRLTGCFTLMISAPFVVLAGMLARRSGVEVLWSIAILLIWLASLGLWRVLLRSRSAQLVGISILCITTVGGSLLLYLIEEFSAIGITVNALFPWSVAVVVGNLLAAGAVVLFSRQVIHRSKPTYPPSGG